AHVGLWARGRAAVRSVAPAMKPGAEWTRWCTPRAASPKRRQLRTRGLQFRSSAWPCRTTHNESLLDKLDLFRVHDFDHRAALLSNPAPHPDWIALQPFRIGPAGGKPPPMTLGNDDCKILCPAPPEVQIYCGAALPHRQDLAFHQCKLSPPSRNPGQIFLPQRGKIGVGPQAAACRPGGTFVP